MQSHARDRELATERRGTAGPSSEQAGETLVLRAAGWTLSRRGGYLRLALLPKRIL